MRPCSLGQTQNEICSKFDLLRNLGRLQGVDICGKRREFHELARGEGVEVFSTETESGKIKRPGEEGGTAQEAQKNQWRKWRP